MTVTLRNYREPADLQLQHDFWVQATRDLPWCWKPTRSPFLYSKGSQFDPRSRCFAFEGDRLVGYSSFTGEGAFVSLGYPWVLPGYEGELQERLYNSVYDFAGSQEYGGRTFAQRFRQPWTSQISFFERHGFLVQSREPIYSLDIRAAAALSVPTRYHLECLAEFRWNDFHQVSAARLPAEELRM